VQPWYYDFIRGNPERPFDADVLVDLLLAADNMHLDPLVELSGAALQAQLLLASPHWALHSLLVSTTTPLSSRDVSPGLSFASPPDMLSIYRIV
jgi:hypothetical protein